MRNNLTYHHGINDADTCRDQRKCAPGKSELKKSRFVIKIIPSIFLAVFFACLSVYGNKTIPDYSAYNQVQDKYSSILRGKVTGKDNSALQGATVIIVGTTKGVNANESGEFYFDRLPEGKLSIQASLMGYRTRLEDITIQVGENVINIMLDEEIFHLDPVMVVAQKREQQILDVPAAVSVVGSDLISRSNITGLSQLAGYVPGLFISEQGANRPSFIIRGLTSEEVSPSAQPRVSVYLNNVPINRASGASIELFDLERVEVSKGPQNTLFGRGSQIGAIHFISTSPGNLTEGYLTAGTGDYGQKEFRGAVNVPVVKNRLFVRAAGVYDFREGFVENTFGGTLNGKNTSAGRLSVRFLPAENHRIDLIVNYQKDDTPGIAFMSKLFPFVLGDTDIFKYTASLEQGDNLRTGKELFDATLNYKYNVTEHTSWSSITSFRKTSASARWDGDGTAAPAIDMWEDAGADQFYQELRLNFSLNSRINGSAGASYWHERADNTYWFSPNEQSMAFLFLNPAYLIMPDGQPMSMPALPDDPSLGPLAGMPLPANHLENNISSAINQTAEAFADLTWQLTEKLFFKGGLRTAYENFMLSNEAEFIGGEPSTLGMLTGNYPNLFFRPDPEKNMEDDAFSLNWQAGLQYRISESSNVFTNYSNGRRPKVLQYTSAGVPEVLAAERIDNLDVGFKSALSERVYVDAVGFYQKYSNFQTRAWIADPGTGEFDYKTLDAGRATSYGMEASVRALIMRGLDLFGNYAYLHATFDETNSDGSTQEYAGNFFRISPEHSFALGMNARVSITQQIIAFASPSYIYKTHYYFEDANTTGLEQPAFGLLNFNLGLELADPSLVLSFFSTNVLDVQFITSAGNTGSLFGVPTFVPGAPRMIGTKLTWMFKSVKQ